MTDFQLDVDSPYPMPTREEVFQKPEVLPYPQEKIPNRHLGHNLDSLLQKALVEQDPEKRQGLTQAIGYYMKLAYTNWHREPVHDDMIKNELSILSNGLLKYETGGYKVHFDARVPNNNNNNGRNFKGNNNRNFKGGRSDQGRDGQGGGGNRNFGRDNQGRDSQGGGNGGGNFKNRNNKYKNNNNKNK
jgi:hypothetical protein